jgi:hypothetical protein
MVLALALAGTSWASDSCDVRYEYRNHELLGTAYIVGDKVNLRKKASTSASVVAQLPVGQKVHSSACVKEDEVLGRSGCWYDVRTELDGKEIAGHLFSFTMTPCQIQGDLNSDGSEERVLATFNRAKQLELLLLDTSGGSDTQRLNLGEHVDFGGPALTGQMILIPKQDAGRTLVSVYINGAQARGGIRWNESLSYTSGQGLSVAASGTSTFDAPYLLNEEVIYFADGSATKRVITGGLDDSGEEYREVEETLLCWQGSVYSPCEPKLP